MTTVTGPVTEMEEESSGYRWETGYEKTWEAIQEDGDGSLEVSVQVGLVPGA